MRAVWIGEKPLCEKFDFSIVFAGVIHRLVLEIDHKPGEELEHVTKRAEVAAQACCEEKFGPGTLAKRVGSTGYFYTGSGQTCPS